MEVRRGQMSMFIVFGIVLVLAFVFVIFLVGEYRSENVDTQTDELINDIEDAKLKLQDIIDGCHRHALREALVLAGLRGGFVMAYRHQYAHIPLTIKDLYTKKEADGTINENLEDEDKDFLKTFFPEKSEAIDEDRDKEEMLNTPVFVYDRETSHKPSGERYELSGEGYYSFEDNFRSYMLIEMGKCLDKGDPQEGAIEKFEDQTGFDVEWDRFAFPVKDHQRPVEVSNLDLLDVETYKNEDISGKDLAMFYEDRVYYGEGEGVSKVKFDGFGGFLNSPPEHNYLTSYDISNIRDVYTSLVGDGAPEIQLGFESESTTSKFTYFFLLKKKGNVSDDNNKIIKESHVEVPVRFELLRRFASRFSEINTRDKFTYDPDILKRVHSEEPGFKSTGITFRRLCSSSSGSNKCPHENPWPNKYQIIYSFSEPNSKILGVPYKFVIGYINNAPRLTEINPQEIKLGAGTFYCVADENMDQHELDYCDLKRYGENNPLPDRIRDRFSCGVHGEEDYLNDDECFGKIESEWIEESQLDGGVLGQEDVERDGYTSCATTNIPCSKVNWLTSGGGDYIKSGNIRCDGYTHWEMPPITITIHDNEAARVYEFKGIYGFNPPC